MINEVTNPDFIAFGSNRAPQKNEPAERAAIGAFFRDESRISDALAVAPARCYRGPLSFIAQEFERRVNVGESLDPVSVITALMPTYPQTDALATEAYESVPHAGRVIHHSHLIATAYRQYCTARLTEEFLLDIDNQGDLDAKVAAFQTELQRLTESPAADDATNTADGISAVLDKWDNPQSRGTSTGYGGLDRLLCGGWQRGRLYILAASTGIGKTTLAANSGWYIARSKSVLMISLEMPRVENFERGLCSELRKSAREMQRIRETGVGLDQLQESMMRLSQRRMFVDDRTGRTVGQIASQCRKHQRKHGLDFLILDYMQLVSPSDRRMNRNDQLGEISRGLKLLAGSLDIPVLALSQLSRAGSSNGRPELHHLRDSGCLEQDADAVLFIHKEKRESETADLIIAKNRSGPTGTVELKWEPQLVRFDEVAQVEHLPQEPEDFSNWHA